MKKDKDNIELFRTPQNEWKYAKEAMQAWRDLAQPIIKATGWRLFSFDPDIQLSSADNHQVVSLPISFILALNTALEK